MTALQRLQLAMSRVRQRLNEIGGLEGDDFTDEIRTEAATLETEYGDLEIRSRALTIGESGNGETGEVADEGDAEARERARLRGLVRVGNYMGAAMELRSVRGETAEGEYNAALGMDATQFPLRLLAPETRASTDTDGAVTVRRWLDRLFSDSAAQRLGVTFESVAAGVASHLVTTAGAAAAQRGRAEVTEDADWTVGVVEMKPARNSVRAVFTREDAARLASLEAALQRDLRMALADGIDAAIFTGDSGATGNAADITGLTTAAVTERTITQTNKVKGPETLTEFAALVDGIHAAGFGDLNIVATVGAWRLWESTIINSAADNMTLAAFLRAAGLSWSSRGNIEAATAAADFGAFVGRGRGIEGAGVAAVWDGGELVRDPYSGAAKGEIALTLHYLWSFALPRASNFARLKFVA